ncbi:MAG: hypothetical protein M1818_001702 [Claussenomyces sp. TS43310]|nr:MAG: hypothetical protein M1818_001702 [Claussenomyces sp. TS43310]
MTSPTEEGFVKLPSEKTLYVSPLRTSLTVSSPNSTSSYPGTQPFSVKSDGGKAYITNQRLVYLPTKPTPDFHSFSCPILNIQDSSIQAPFFGANYWAAIARPVAGGNIPPAYPFVELKMIFREGGAYDYHTVFEQIKERLYNAMSLAREEGRATGSSRGLGGVDYANVDLEQLPAYEPAREVDDTGYVDERGLVSPALSSTSQPMTSDTGAEGLRNSGLPESAGQSFVPPSEPPPGYEEAQSQAVGIDLDQRLREEAERQ